MMFTFVVGIFMNPEVLVPEGPGFVVNGPAKYLGPDGANISVGYQSYMYVLFYLFSWAWRPSSGQL